MVGHRREDRGTPRVEIVDLGQVADERVRFAAEVFEQGPLDLGDAEQVEVAGECDDQAAASGGVLDLHGPPSGGSRRAGLPDARVAPYATTGSASCCMWLDGRSQIGPGPYRNGWAFLEARRQVVQWHGKRS